MVLRRRIRSGTSTKHSVILTAALALIAGPLAVIGGNAAIDLVQNNGSGPIDAAMKQVSLADAASVLVEDAAIATQSIADELHPNRGVVKEITSDKEFSQFALTWRGSADVASFVRSQRADGTWSEWFDAEPQFPSDGQGNGLNGTELLYVEPTKKVQVSTLGLNVFGPGSGVNIEDIKGAENLDLSSLNPADSPHYEPPAVVKEAAGKVTDSLKPAGGKWTDIVPIANEMPLDQVEAVLIDGNAAASAIDPIVDGKNVTGMPKVITRAGWGANENSRCLAPEYDNKLKAATVHHTAGSNNYSQAEAAGIVRGIYKYHAQTLGWCDIGYNALVDKFGNIYEGRYGGLDKNVQGAHAGGFNEGTFGISMMGDYSTVQPSEATINAVGNMIGWRMKVAGVEPEGKTSLTSGGTSYAKYAYGTPVSLPNIFAHRDVGNTTCPGNAGYSQMPTIRSIAEKKYKALTNGTITNESANGDTGLFTNPGFGNNSNASSPSSTTSSTSTTSKAPSNVPAPSNLSATKSPSSSSSAANSTNSTNSANPAGAKEPVASSSSSQTNAGTDNQASAIQAVTGARSMLASALGMLGAPGLGATAEAILESVGRSIENGPTIADLPVLAGKILAINQQNDLAKEWQTISEKFGSVLGNALSGVQTGATVANKDGLADTLRYVKFDKGIITSSNSTGTNALWGKIADAWAQQGFEVGKLGAPISTQTRSGTVEKAEFQNGTITYNSESGKVDVQNR